MHCLQYLSWPFNYGATLYMVCTVHVYMVCTTYNTWIMQCCTQAGHQLSWPLLCCSLHSVIWKLYYTITVSIQLHSTIHTVYSTLYYTGYPGHYYAAACPAGPSGRSQHLASPSAPSSNKSDLRYSSNKSDPRYSRYILENTPVSRIKPWGQTLPVAIFFHREPDQWICCMTLWYPDRDIFRCIWMISSLDVFFWSVKKNILNFPKADILKFQKLTFRIPESDILKEGLHPFGLSHLTSNILNIFW